MSTYPFHSYFWILQNDALTLINTFLTWKKYFGCVSVFLTTHFVSYYLDITPTNTNSYIHYSVRYSFMLNTTQISKHELTTFFETYLIRNTSAHVSLFETSASFVNWTLDVHNSTQRKKLCTNLHLFKREK